jgi:hypothetical protein
MVDLMVTYMEMRSPPPKFRAYLRQIETFPD